MMTKPDTPAGGVLAEARALADLNWQISFAEVLKHNPAMNGGCAFCGADSEEGCLLCAEQPL